MPGETVGLHIFEQRYQVLFNDLEAMHVDEFGIPFFHDSNLACGCQNAAWSRCKSATREATRRGCHRDRPVSIEEHGRNSGVVPYPLGEVEDIQEWSNWPLGKACADARDALIQDMKVA